VSSVAAAAFPAEQWGELLQALCAGDPSRIGTIQGGEGLVSVGPTRFAWLTGFAWRPVGETFGIAILELAAPGMFPPDAWTPSIGPLVRGPGVVGRGPVLQGLAALPETGNRAAVYLTVDGQPDDPRTRVTEVMIRIEPL
jgi:hypothetical protein